jgi:hypothetical protein
MTFLLPWCLLGLLPWAVVALWMLWGQREKVGVPFLPLWDGDQPTRARRRAIQPPPIALAAALLAILLAVLAAARPAIFSSQTGHITIVADRGLTMSIQNSQGQSRLVASAELARTQLPDAADVSVDLKVVPDPHEKAASGDWLGQVRSMAPTAVADPQAVARAARAALADSVGPVVVLSDQAIGLQNDRLVQVVPAQPLVNVGIDLLSVRQQPWGQIMARVVNQSPLKQARLIVRGGSIQITRKIALPPAGQSKNYFVDLPTAWPSVEVEVVADDGAAPNHRAWGVRRSAWPRIEAHSPLSPEMERMIQVYSHDRPAGEESKTVAIVNSSVAPPPDSPAALVSDAGPTMLETVQPLVIADDPLKLADVDWDKVLVGASVAAAPAGDWTPLVTAGGTVVVAARTEPVRQVWIGFASPQFARLADFAIFWNDVFSWLGEGGASYTSAPIGPLAGQWQLKEPTDVSMRPADAGLAPGVYVGADGTLRAVNSGTATAGGASTPDWQSKLQDLANQSQRRPHELSGALLIIALVLLGISAASWVRGRAPQRTFQVPVGR